MGWPSSLVYGSILVALGCPPTIVRSDRIASTHAAGIKYCNAALCIYQNYDGTGLYVGMRGGYENLSKEFKGRMNDQASYVWSRGADAPYCLYEHAGFKGHTLMVNPGVKRSLLVVGQDGFRWNDKVSSVRKALYLKPPRYPFGRWTCNVLDRYDILR